MVDKKRRSFTIDADIHDDLDRKENLNASATVNALLREYMAAGREPEAALTMRLNEIESELQGKRERLARLESEIDRLERERDDVAAKIRERDRNQHEYVEHVVEKIEAGEITHDQLNHDNVAIQQQADNANLPVERFIEKVEAELSGE